MSAMSATALLAIHFLVLFMKVLMPGRIKSVIAENLLLTTTTYCHGPEQPQSTELNRGRPVHLWLSVVIHFRT